MRPDVLASLCARKLHAARRKLVYKGLATYVETPDLTTWVSAGSGSVALEQQKDKNIDFSRTFGAPVVDLNPFKRGTQERYRHPLDPVSILDRGANWGDFKAYPHSYGGFQSMDHKTLALGMRNST